MNTGRERKIVKALLGDCLFAVFSALSPAMALGQERLPTVPLSAHETAASLATDQFILIAAPKSFMVQATLNGMKRQVAVPRAWLIPPAQEEDDSMKLASSFKYGKRITSFAIGNGNIGLHLSSFDLMTEGSAQAAAGRDVFLVYDPRSASVEKGLADLGVTKSRGRDAACFSAQSAHFLLADVNRDGFNDIGLVKEVIECRDVRSDLNEHKPSKPLYSQQPVRWYVFRSGRWRPDPALRGKLPKEITALPLIGMVLNPVDYVAHGLWKSRDPAKWDSRSSEPVPYLPPYRR
jgi:hypothetical protein